MVKRLQVRVLDISNPLRTVLVSERRIIVAAQDGIVAFEIRRVLDVKL